MVPCGRLSWLLVCFWAHVKIVVSYRIFRLQDIELLTCHRLSAILPMFYFTSKARCSWIGCSVGSESLRTTLRSRCTVCCVMHFVGLQRTVQSRAKLIFLVHFFSCWCCCCCCQNVSMAMVYQHLAISRWATLFDSYILSRQQPKCAMCNGFIRSNESDSVWMRDCKRQL